MKTMVSSFSFTLASLALATLPAQAAHHEELQFGPVELMACTYKEDKNSEDLKKLTEAFNEWLEDNDTAYTYFILTPRYRESGSKMDFAWIGGWGSGAAMGAGYDAWMRGDDGVGNMFGEVMDCAYSLSAVTDIHMPEGERSSDGVVWFSRCTLEEGTTLTDAIAGHRATSAAMQELGEVETAQWAFLPGLGFGDVEFDYYHVQSWENYTQLGMGFDAYFNKGGWKKQAEAQGDKVSCESPNLYDSRQIRAGQ